MPSTVLDQLVRFGPDHCEPLSVEAASAYTHDLATTHYENFTVVSRFVPAHLRQDFANVYAFCRWADDLGDETGDRDRSLDLLGWWRDELERCYDGRPRHPVFVALRATIETHAIPRRPFDDLIDAFVQDQTVTRYETWEQVLDYCTRSADPVGRLVLYLCGYRDERRQRLSDATCTALQLTNFWQDVRRDVLERDRVYIPADVAERHGLDLDLMVKVIRASTGDEGSGGARVDGMRCGACPPYAGVRVVRPPFVAAMRELVGRTWPLFERGRGLWPLLDVGCRGQIKLFTYGGEAVLRRIARQGCDTLTVRPRLGKVAKLGLMLRAVGGTLLDRGRVGGAASGGPAGAAAGSTTTDHG